MGIGRQSADMAEIIREEKRLVAVESLSEAWAETVSAGVEPEIIAEAALATALGELYRTSGEDAVVALLDRMRERAIAGEFEDHRVTH